MRECCGVDTLVCHANREQFDASAVHRPPVPSITRPILQHFRVVHKPEIMVDAATTTEPLVPFFKKRSKGRPATTRVRETSPTASSSTAGGSGPSASSEVVVPTKRSQPSLFVQGTAGKRKKRTDDNTTSDNEDSSANPLDVKWSSLGSKARLEAGMELEAEDAEEAEEELRRKRRRDENDGYDPDDDKKIIDGTYRGQKGYQTLIKKRQEVPKAARVGPQRGTSTIKTVTLVDYQPDVCKDYKGEQKYPRWFP